MSLSPRPHTLLSEIASYKANQIVHAALIHMTDNPLAVAPDHIKYRFQQIDWNSVSDSIISGVIPSLINKKTSPDMISFEVYC